MAQLTNKEVIKFLNAAIKNGFLDQKAIGPENLARLKANIIIKDRTLNLRSKDPNLSESTRVHAQDQLAIVKKFSQQTATIQPERLKLSVTQINEDIARLNTERNGLIEQIKDIQVEVTKHSGPRGEPDAYNKATDMLSVSKSELRSTLFNIHTQQALKQVMKEQSLEKTSSIQRESVDQSTRRHSMPPQSAPRRESVSQQNSNRRRSSEQQNSTPRRSMTDQKSARRRLSAVFRKSVSQQPKGPTKEVKSLVSKITNLENIIQTLAEKRDKLVSHDLVKEEFGLYTDSIKDQRSRANSLYKKLDTLDPKMAEKVKATFADSPYGKVPCPLTPSEIKVNKANAKFDKAYHDVPSVEKTDTKLKINTDMLSPETVRLNEKKMVRNAIKKELGATQEKLNVYKTSKWNIVGKVSNFFHRKEIQALKNQKKELVAKLEPLKNPPQKSILKPTLKEKVTAAHDKQEQKMKDQKPREDRAPSPSFVKS
ncbi:hypothetical protein [Candidatus Enterococcus mangumiae]|uniref:Uncharacterized protein n=1 Tax=Candidatus Enterococcus mangumiae TaxID=2230878 RepID=A0ABZ2SV24_9ENTE|nr:hypothetical protein [Enterococcus sp. DIV1094]MBO0490921.1 hypothetical protein [Enterococcus sp. DIV1094]